MKVHLPEISWHGRHAIMSVDVHSSGRLASASADRTVRIWKLVVSAEGVPHVRFLSNLAVHENAVNMVRFSPNGQFLASCSDDGVIYISRKATAEEESNAAAQPKPFGASSGDGEDAFMQDALDEDLEQAETWVRQAALHLHPKDVLSLAWSPCSEYLASGAVDTKVIVWHVPSARAVQEISHHRSFVQGLAWDPLMHFLVSTSSDRSARIYTLRNARPKKNSNMFAPHSTLRRRYISATEAKQLAQEGQSPAASPAAEAAVAAAEEAAAVQAASSSSATSPSRPPSRSPSPSPSPSKQLSKADESKVPSHPMFSPDQGLTIFFRRPEWSPDGSLLLMPAGQYQRLPRKNGDGLLVDEADCEDESELAYTLLKGDEEASARARGGELFEETRTRKGKKKRAKKKERTLKSRKDKKVQVVYGFHRSDLKNPILMLPALFTTVSVRFCPVLFEPVAPNPNAGARLSALPYRMIFAVASTERVFVYDTEHIAPLLVLDKVHYAGITDLAWSHDGRTLVISSLDGYCTLVRFSPGELGTPLGFSEDADVRQRWTAKRAELVEQATNISKKKSTGDRRSSKASSKAGSKAGSKASAAAAAAAAAANKDNPAGTDVPAVFAPMVRSAPASKKRKTIAPTLVLDELTEAVVAPPKQEAEKKEEEEEVVHQPLVKKAKKVQNVIAPMMVE